jgi:hypothetical protein
VQLGVQFVGQDKRQWHGFLSLIGCIAEHNTLEKAEINSKF